MGVVPAGLYQPTEAQKSVHRQPPKAATNTCIYEVDSYYTGHYTVPVPLRAVSATVQIRDVLCGVTLTQTYFNAGPVPIEALYVFPIDEKAAITQFQCTIGDKTIVGVIQPKDEARAHYEHAIKTGHHAVLLEQGSAADIFRARVGNIGPNETVEVHITYISELDYEGDDIRFVLPTTIAPRFTPALETLARLSRPSTTQDATGPADTSQVALYGLNVSVDATFSSQVVHVRSPSHPIAFNTSDANAKASLELDDLALDSDLVILFSITSPHEPRLVCEVDGQGRVAAMVSLCPQFGPSAPPPIATGHEIVFIVDRSGSMAGSKISSCREALHLFLRALPLGVTFNIVGFGSRMLSLFDKPTEYSDESVAKAAAYIDGMDADLGGTELMNPLLLAYGEPPRPTSSFMPGYRSTTAQQRHRKPPAAGRTVFVLTDGEVSNTKEITDLVSAHTENTRTFSLGLGESASRALVSGIARCGNGTSEFVLGGSDRPQAKVMRQLRVALTPALSAVRIKWEAPSAASAGKTVRGVVEQCPHRVPPVISGHRFVIYSLFPPGVTPSAVTISAFAPGGPLTARLEGDTGGPYEGSTLHVLAARARIRELEEEGGHEVPAGPFGRPSKKPPPAKDEIMYLAMEYGLASPFTSFVAIDQEKTFRGSVDGPERHHVPSVQKASTGARMQADRERRELEAKIALTALSADEIAPAKAGRGRGAPKMPRKKQSEKMKKRSHAPEFQQQVPPPPGAPPSRSLSAAPAPPPSLPMMGGGGGSFELMAKKISDDSEDLKAEQFIGDDDDSDEELLLQELEEEEKEAGLPTEPIIDTMVSLIALQGITGCWQPSPALATALCRNEDVFLTDQKPQAWATALSIAFLEHFWSEREDEWILAVEKGRQWLAQHVDDVAALIAAAGKVFKK